MRTLDVIEFVVAHRQGVVAQEIAGALAIPVSSLSYLLATLTERGYLTRAGRRYLPGPGLQRLHAPDAAQSLEDRVAPLVRALKGELNETAAFMVQRGWEVESLVTEASDQALRYAVEPGTRRPLHALAAGKVASAAQKQAEQTASRQGFRSHVRPAARWLTECDNLVYGRGFAHSSGQLEYAATPQSAAQAL